MTVLVLSGSTAVGKTELSLHLAQRLNGEIISADSAQVNSITFLQTAIFGAYNRFTKEWILVLPN